MQIEKAGALALIAGVLSGAVVMALHPTHGDLPRLWGDVTINQVVHGLAIIASPVMVFGAAVLSRWLGLDRPLSLLGFCFYLFSMLVVIFAAIMSGFVQMQIHAAMREPGADGGGLHAMADLTWFLNQAFAHWHTALGSLALLFWSLAWRGMGVKALGLVVSLGVLAWQLSGTLRLDVHGMGAVVLAQGIWLIAAAMGMWRSTRT